MWLQISKTKILHESGYCIQLEKGSWRQPTDLLIDIPDGMNASVSSELLRAGLVYVNSRHTSRSATEEPVRPVLSLKKRE